MKEKILKIKKNRVEVDNLNNEYEDMKSISDLSLFGRPDIKVGCKIVNNFGCASSGKEVVINKINLDYVSTWTNSFRQSVSYTPINKDGSLSKNTHDAVMYLKLIE